MIIVSQDRKSIYNFNNIKSIDVLDNEIYITDNILSDEGACIGIYKTEERAKEVLESIWSSYAIFERLKMPLDKERQTIIFEELQRYNTRPFIYKMPEE